MPEFIITLIIDAEDQREAEKTTEAIADTAQAIVVSVEPIKE